MTSDLILQLAEAGSAAMIPVAEVAALIRVEREARGGWRPAAGGLWRVEQIAREFGRKTTWVHGHLHQEHFGPLGEPGGPVRESDSRKSPWLIPDERVSAFREWLKSGGVTPLPTPGVTPLHARPTKASEQLAARSAQRRPGAARIG